MRKAFIILGLIALSLQQACAQDIYKYHKSSMYSVMLKHENQEFADEIVAAFNKIPIQDNFYDLNLSKRWFKAGILEDSDTSKADNQKPHIDRILRDNAIGRRLVAKWFNQDKQGCFSPTLILQRGFYNVNASDIIEALYSRKTQEGVIYDAGEELIGQTYVLVNDIQYGDKRKDRERRVSNLTTIAGMASMIPGVGLLATTYAQAGSAFIGQKYAGFNVTVTSYLYRLDWTEDIANGFYTAYYTDKPDAAKKESFKNEKSLFTLTYIGSQTVHSSNSNLKGINDRETQIRKVSTRAIDEALAKLQKEHPEFRVRAPLISKSPLIAPIGLREEMGTDTRYEVLEVGETATKRTTYKRVAVIKPKKGRIWDNRYMAEFDDDYKPMSGTEFELVSGSVPNDNRVFLIREIDN